MELTRFTDVGRFLGFAGPFLAAREAEHNLIFGVANTLRETPELYTAAPYLAVVGHGPRIVAVALQTPPFRLILSEVDDPAALGVLAGDSLERDLPGVVGGVEVVDAFIAEWTARGGRPARIEMAEQIYQLSAVVPPRPVGGRWRIAEPGDRELVAAWSHAFMLEALHEDDEPGRGRDGRPLAGTHWPHPVPVGGRRRRVDDGRRWPDPERDPDRAGLHATGAARPRLRQRARRGGQPGQLDAGRRFCFLFTDAGEPDLEPHLPGDRLRAGPRRARLRVRAGMTAEGEEAPVAASRPPEVVGESRWPMTIAVVTLMAFALAAAPHLAFFPGPGSSR